MMAGALGERSWRAPGRLFQASTRTRSAPARCTSGFGPAGEGMDVSEYRRILLDGAVVEVTRVDDELIAPDGRTVDLNDAVHLPPCQPSKIIAVHLNHRSRVEEFQTRLPAAPTYFHKPTSALNAHNGAVVRPRGLPVAQLRGARVAIVNRPPTCRKHRRFPRPATTSAATPVANDYGLHDFRDTDAGSMPAGQGLGHVVPLGSRARHRLGFPWQDADYPGSTGEVRASAAAPTRWSGDMHYLVADIARDHHPVPRRRAAVGDARPTPDRCGRGDVVEVEVDGLGVLPQPHRQRADRGARPDVGAQPTESEEVLSTAPRRRLGSFRGHPPAHAGDAGVTPRVWEGAFPTLRGGY